MGFLAKGSNIIINEGSDSEAVSYLAKVMKSDGTFEDFTFGDTISDLDKPITYSQWTTFGAYKYISLGMVRQVYSKVHLFNRNMKFDSTLKLSTTVVPEDSDTSGVKLITALVKGKQNASVTDIAQTAIDEYITESYSSVIAIGVMNEAFRNDMAIDETTSDVKTYSGAALVQHDYSLPETEAVYLINLAISTTKDMENITSLSIGVTNQLFTEYLGTGKVAPGTIGKTEMNASYKPENAINNYIINISDDMIHSGTLIITQNIVPEIHDNSVYFMSINTTSEPSFTKISSGYYDSDSEQYVATGTEYTTTISGNVKSKLCLAIIRNKEFTIKALV